jgi:hypothetical protein
VFSEQAEGTMAEVGRLPFVRVALPVARSAVPRPQDEALSRRTALTLSGSRGCCRTREHLAENRGPVGEKDPLANEDSRNPFPSILCARLPNISSDC